MSVQSNWTRESILSFLSRYAPQAPLGSALSLANDFDATDRSLMHAQEAMAVLSESVIGLSKHGELTENLKLHRPAIQWALKKVQYCHGWVVIGPVSSALDRLMDRIEQEEKP